MQARAVAVEELVESGTLDELRGDSTKHSTVRLAQLQTSSQVDQELARLKGEIGSGCAAERARAVIVRLMGEGQYQVSDELRERLALDEEAMAALADEDEGELDAKLDEMAALVRSEGERLPDEDLSPSDAVIPPSDLTLEETRQLFSEDGLIPDLPAP